MTGVAKKTVMRFLVQAGSVARDYQYRSFKNLSCRRIQVDEMWAFVGAKQKNLTPENQARGAVGDIWLWSAVDADTKLVPSWMLGDRNASTARMFLLDLAGRLNNRVQLTSDSHGAYLKAVEGAFGHEIDYAQLQKLYGETSESEKRYSPAQCVGCKRQELIGEPDPKHISMSFVERHNSLCSHDESPVHSTDERIQQKAREPCRSGCSWLLCLQLHQDSSHVACHARNGGWCERSTVGSVGPSCVDRSRRTRIRKSGVKSRDRPAEQAAQYFCVRL